MTILTAVVVWCVLSVPVSLIVGKALHRTSTETTRPYLKVV